MSKNCYTGKNLFDKNSIINNSSYANDIGKSVRVYENFNVFRTQLLDKQSDIITISSNASNALFRVLIFDENKILLSTNQYKNLPQTIDISTGKYYALYFDKTTISFDNNIQIENGSSATEYDEYIYTCEYSKDLSGMTGQLTGGVTSAGLFKTVSPVFAFIIVIIAFSLGFTLLKNAIKGGKDGQAKL